MRRSPRGIPTASPIVRDESEEDEEEGAGDVSEAAAIPAEDVDDDSVDDELELVVSLGAFAVVV